MLNFLKREPAFTGSLLSLVGAAIGVFIHNPPLVAALVGVAATFLGVRQVVTPVTTMAENVAEAATTAATQTVEQLGKTTVGTVGEITDAARSIIGGVVSALRGK